VNFEEFGPHWQFGIERNGEIDLERAKEQAWPYVKSANLIWLPPRRLTPWLAAPRCGQCYGKG